MSDSNAAKVLELPIVDVRVKKSQPKKVGDFKLIDIPDDLPAKRYRFKPPNYPHHYYITITHMEREIDGVSRLMPAEIFLNSKNQDGHDLLQALMVTISTTFRHECSRIDGNPTFLIHQLRSIPNPNGPYFYKGKLYSSIVAHIADIMNQDFISIGLIEDQAESEELMQKREEAEEKGLLNTAKQCGNCGAMAVVRLDCEICLECGTSNCG